MHFSAINLSAAALVAAAQLLGACTKPSTTAGTRSVNVENSTTAGDGTSGGVPVELDGRQARSGNTANDTFNVVCDNYFGPGEKALDALAGVVFGPGPKNSVNVKDELGLKLKAAGYDPSKQAMVVGFYSRSTETLTSSSTEKFYELSVGPNYNWNKDKFVDNTKGAVIHFDLSVEGKEEVPSKLSGTLFGPKRTEARVFGKVQFKGKNVGEWDAASSSGCSISKLCSDEYSSACNLTLAQSNSGEPGYITSIDVK